MNIVTRKEAQKQGFKTYNNGKLCKLKHGSIRYTACGTCIQCKPLNNKRYALNNPDKHKQQKQGWVVNNPEYAEKYRKDNKDRKRELNRLYRELNKDRLIASSRLYRIENLEKVKEGQRNYYARNKDKVLETVKAYCKKNPEKIKARSAKRRARKIQAFPVWANPEEIKKIYESCPKGYHVDHIVPLKGVDEKGKHTVCGLHVEFNLQHLPAVENLKKGNKVESRKEDEQ